jgi:hypothetical protein
VLGIVFHSVLLQERQELFFEVALAMMFGLSLDIGDGVFFCEIPTVKAP